MNGIDLVLSVVAGMSLGVLFYGGLWLTVRWLPGSRRPALLMMTSLVLRAMLVLAGLYLLGAGEGLRLMAALAGVMLSRWILVRRLPAPVKEVGEWS